MCARVCPYHAITPADKKAGIYPTIIQAACAGCGTCGAECTMDAITMRHFTDLQIMAQIDSILEEDPMDKIVSLRLQLVLLCRWRSCRYLTSAISDECSTDPNHVQWPGR